VSIAVLLDVATASFASMLVARHEKVQETIDVKEFV